MRRSQQYFAGAEEPRSRQYPLAVCIILLLFIPSALCIYGNRAASGAELIPVGSPAADEPHTENTGIDRNALFEASEEPEDIRKETEVNEKFIPLLEINKDIAGWLTVPGTTIDYPVMQTGNNTDYLTLNFWREYSVFGTPFIDCGTQLNPKSKNIVIYGHSVQGTGLMGQLHRYLVQSYYEENRSFTFSSLYEDHSYELVAACVIGITGEDVIDYTQSSFFRRDLLICYVDSMVNASYISTGVEYSADDHFLTIQTCSGEAADAMLVILAKEME